MKDYRQRAFALGTTLLLAMLVTVVAFAVAALCIAYLYVMRRSDDKACARRMAHNAVLCALFQVEAHDDWGLGSQAAQATIHLTAPAGEPAEAEGFLTFDPATATSWGIPFSQNLKGLPSQAGAPEASTVCPTNGLYLIGVGRGPGGAQVRVERGFTVPAFPGAVVCQGALTSQGAVLVGGLSQMPAPGVLPSPDADTDLRSGQGVLLAGGTQVKGNVLAAGEVGEAGNATLFVGPQPPSSLGSSVWVTGAVKPGTALSNTTAVNLLQYDPTALHPESLGQDRYPEAQVLAKPTMRSGDLTFEDGLQLTSGTLFVKGNLTVHGGLHGVGRVVATGNITLDGNAQLASGDGLAVMAGGSLSLTGSGAGGSSFQGMLYSGSGGVVVDKVAVVGPVVSMGSEPVSLRDATLLLPQSVAQTGDLTGGGGGGGGVNTDTTVPSYWHGANPLTPADASWDRAYLYQRHLNNPADPNSGYYYTQTTFTKVNGVPTQSGATGPVSIDTAQSNGADRAQLQTRTVTPVGDPPTPPADPQHPAATGFTVDPSQFFKLEDRIRLIYRHES